MDASMLPPHNGFSSMRRVVRAGPLSLLFDAGDLRYITWGGREIIRRIYATVRDRNWGTVPARISDLNLEQSENSFCISYTSRHCQNEIQFVWQASIIGSEDGTILFTFDGEAKRTFLRNRIGFCVLHPIRECAGAKCRVRYADGTVRELRFPDTIASEQPVKWMHDLAGLDHEVAPGVWAETEFAGDLFETEDQRNWIDASFKTYCTPLRLPFPTEVKAGTRVQQNVRLRIADRSRLASGATSTFPDATGPLRRERDVTVAIRAMAASVRLPALGLGLASHGHPLLAIEVGRLRNLHLAHLRVDLHLWEADWLEHLQRAADEAGKLKVKLEAALQLDAVPERELAMAVGELARLGGGLACVQVFQRNQKSTTTAALQAARAALMGRLPDVPIGAGTDGDLYQLNLQRPPADADYICWSMNPQVHAFDESSIAETPEAAVDQVRSVRSYFPGKPLVVSPVTLKPRFNPNATGPAPDLPPDELPPEVDPRQPSRFAAAWTLAMIKSLAESGVDRMTFFETTGQRGVMERDSELALHETFPSIAGAVFPLYHVLADVGEFAGGEVLRTESSDPLSVTTLLLKAGSRCRWILANLTVEPRRVILQNFERIVLARVMDSSNSGSTMTRPEEFRAHSIPLHVNKLDLGPYAVATLDFDEADAP